MLSSRSSMTYYGVVFFDMCLLSGPPMLITFPQSRSIDENQVQTFTCSATGLPRPNITWTLNGTEIMTGDTFTIVNRISADSTSINSTLSFTALFDAVSGNGHYNCVATNTQPPQAVASATLQVFSKFHASSLSLVSSLCFSLKLYCSQFTSLYSGAFICLSFLNIKF